MDRAENVFIEEIVTVYRQYLTSGSWKRRNDLRKQLTGMEKELRQYQRYKDGVRKEKTCGYQAV